jgi:hypothetical protein
MTSNLISYLAIGARPSNGKFKLILKRPGSHDDPNNKKYLADIQNSLNRIAGSNQQIGDEYTQTVNSVDGTYIIHVFARKHGDMLHVYFATVTPEFGRRYFPNHLMKEFENMHTYGIPFEQVCDKLLSTYGRDKLSDVQVKVEQVRVVMRDNVDKAIDSVEKLKDMEIKAQHLEEDAETFELSASKVKRMMCIRKWKITGVIALVVVVILTIIIVPLVTK